ncbi:MULTISPECIES: LysR family transcriptional regulator [Paraburkholderia]|jgi:DNA-binding transcriptional LysR family regulator|uniref:Transcriptional regulator, LysR family n=1 Tax=Paraburkholderia phenazinium TaxID=60549 RepID=A0A1N6K0F1_9BURK|nr:LysR family transcriptional regulator [Paraburkholderia phenazinium]SIO41873.1 transcriptional regulator, LysR family [Paraburkholderia phenazinium]SIO50065.1 transcriptional regulator, LysR family [Paraburkholderia phenazinium]
MAFDTRLLNGIGVLAAVVESGSFVHAAEALGVTASAVSRAVARMEQRIGIRLFDRTSRAVKLTDEGQRFYERVAPLLAEMEDAATETAGSSVNVRGRLRVNVDPWFARFILAPKLEKFLSAQPSLHVELAIRDRLGDLVAEGFDAAVRFGVPEASSLVARPLLSTRILTCSSAAYLARHGRPAHPLELADGRYECLLFRDSSTGRPFPWEFHRNGEVLTVPVSGRLIVNDLATKLSACAAGLGITQTMELGAHQWLGDGSLVELFPEWAQEQLPLYVYYPSRRLVSAKMRAFIDLLTADIG